MMVEKNIVRLLGKKSSARFNAYLTACWIFDRYGTVNGTIIDPTMPVERRNDREELVDQDGKPILNSRGQPVKNLKSKEAVRQLDRQPNPQRGRYPVLNIDDFSEIVLSRAVSRWSSDVNI